MFLLFLEKNNLRYFKNLEIETRFNDMYFTIFIIYTILKQYFRRKKRILRCYTVRNPQISVVRLLQIDEHDLYFIDEGLREGVEAVQKEFPLG